MTTKIDIANLALTYLGENTITALTDENKSARTMNLLFDLTMRAELEQHPWRFAMTRVSLAADSEEPAFGYDAQFTLPGDFVRLIPQLDQQDMYIEGRKVLTSLDAPLEIIYIKEITDLTECTSLFKTALAYRLAMDAALPLTQSNTRRDQMAQFYQETIRLARRSNAFQTPAAQFPDSQYIQARL